MISLLQMGFFLTADQIVSDRRSGENSFEASTSQKGSRRGGFTLRRPQRHIVTCMGMYACRNNYYLINVLGNRKCAEWAAGSRLLDKQRKTDIGCRGSQHFSTKAFHLAPVCRKHMQLYGNRHACNRMPYGAFSYPPLRWETCWNHESAPHLGARIILY